MNCREGKSSGRGTQKDLLVGDQVEFFQEASREQPPPPPRPTQSSDHPLARGPTPHGSLVSRPVWDYQLRDLGQAP